MARSNGLDFRIRLKGDEAILGKYEGIEERLQDLRPALEDVSDLLESGEQRLFDQMRGKYVRTGRLRESLTNSLSADAIRSITGDTLVFGTSVYYARFQQKIGTTRTKGSRQASS
jgi:hypothetical protein